MGLREAKDETFLSRPVLGEAEGEVSPEMVGFQEVRCRCPSEEGRLG